MYECFVHVYLFMCVLELEMVVNCHVGIGNRSQVLHKSKYSFFFFEAQTYSIRYNSLEICKQYV